MTLEQEKRRRGFRSQAYLDPDGNWLIGYGHPSKEGETCTIQQAEQWLREDMGDGE